MIKIPKVYTCAVCSEGYIHSEVQPGFTWLRNWCWFCITTYFSGEDLFHEYRPDRMVVKFKKISPTFHIVNRWEHINRHHFRRGVPKRKI